MFPAQASIVNILIGCGKARNVKMIEPSEPERIIHIAEVDGQRSYVSKISVAELLALPDDQNFYALDDENGSSEYFIPAPPSADYEKIVAAAERCVNACYSRSWQDSDKAELEKVFSANTGKNDPVKEWTDYYIEQKLSTKLVHFNPSSIGIIDENFVDIDTIIRMEILESAGPDYKQGEEVVLGLRLYLLRDRGVWKVGSVHYYRVE